MSDDPHCGVTPLPPCGTLSGRCVVLIALGLATVLSFSALAYRRSQGDQAHAFWGTDSAELIANAPDVFLVQFSPATDKPIQRNGEAALPDQPGADISRARGLQNFRLALLRDLSYRWDGPGTADASPQEPDWRYGLRFRNGDAEVFVRISADGSVVRNRSGGLADSTPISRGMIEFLTDAAPQTD